MACSPHMSGNTAAQPVTGNASSLTPSSPMLAMLSTSRSTRMTNMANTDSLGARNDLSEKNYLPSASQQGSSLASPPPNPETGDEHPSPRRGSKRSLIGRSRQGSRSSRRSARGTARATESKDHPPLPSNDAARTERKQKSGGFLSFLNCCRADEDSDELKPEEPHVPAKQRKIEATPSRAAVPDDHGETFSEKPRPQETPQEIGRAHV